MMGLAALKDHALNLTLDAPALILTVLGTVLLSAKTNAWFYVSWSLASIANIVTAILTTILYAVCSAQPTELARKIRLTLSLALAATVLANCVLLLGARQVLDLFGHRYAAQAAWSLRILALESFPFIIKSHYIAVSRIQRRVAPATLLTIATGSLELRRAALGARLGGLSGCGLGWVATVGIEAVIMFRTVCRAAQSIDESTSQRGHE